MFINKYFIVKQSVLWLKYSRFEKKRKLNLFFFKFFIQYPNNGGQISA